MKCRELTSLTQSWMMASISTSLILVMPCLEQNKRKFLSEKPLRTSGKFCLNKLLISVYVLFAFTWLLITSTLLSKYSIMKQGAKFKCSFDNGAKMFSEYFNSRHFWQLSKRPNRESGKKSTFFYFDEDGEKLKKIEKCLVLTFSR